MPAQEFTLDERSRARLAEYAERRGITVEEAAEELVSDELRSRTKPRASKGSVTPFRRR